MIVLMMTVLDGTIVNVALPAMSREFNIGDSASVWIVSIYQLVITMLLLPVSSAGDLFSYRRILKWGIVIFTVASGLCAASGSFAMLLAARSMQGVGAACIMGVNIALMRLIYPAKYLGRGMALNAMVIAVSTAAGPTIAGALISFVSWHWIFLINIPLGALALVLSWRSLPLNPQKINQRFDIASGLANAATFGLLILGLEQIVRSGQQLYGALELAGAVVAGVFYYRRQAGRSNPLLPIDLLKIRLYLLSLITSISSFIAQTMAMVTLPFMLIGRFDKSAVATGLLITPWPIGTLLTSPIGARIAERVNPAIEAAVGMGIFSFGLLSLTMLPSNPSTLDIAWRMLLCGIGFGFFQTPNNLVLVQATPLHRTGGAGGLQSTGRLLGQTLGATLVTILFMLMPQGSSDTVCIYIAAGFAVLALTLSLTRSGRARPGAT